MQPSSSAASARAESARSPTDRKRKRAVRKPTSETLTRQHTLQALVEGQQRSAAAPTTPDRKRLRAGSGPPDSATSPHRAIAPADMYAFSSRSPVATAPSDIVDLTNGSPGRPSQVQRLGGPIKPRAGITPQTGAKKLVVKNLKQNASWDSKAYLEKIWGELDGALTGIFDDQQDGISMEGLYRGVENVCRQGGASTLFGRLEGRCRSHIIQHISERLISLGNLDNVAILQATLGEWTKWKAQMTTIRAMFFFLDRSYLLPSSKPTLSELTPQFFRDLVFRNDSLKPRIIDGACDLVAADRVQPAGVSDLLFRQAVTMLHELSVYTASFEPRFLSKTQDYIATYSDQLIEDKAVPEYVSIADHIIAREMARCDEHSLDASTRRDLLTLLEDHLVQRKVTDLTEFEPLKALLDNSNSTPDLAALYALLARRRLGDKLRPAFEKWIDQVGTAIVFADESEDMIVLLLSLKRRLDQIWLNAFQRDEALGHGLRDTFEAFVNKTKKGQSTWGTDNTKVGEMIAKYVDQLLRGGVKAIPEDLTARRSSSITGPPPKLAGVKQQTAEDNEDPDIDDDEEVKIQLDQVLDLFRFLHGKAVFEAFYKKDLARRLLMGRSASADAERSMLTRLKTECGSQFTQNLEQMFKDVELAREEMQSYKLRLENRIGYEKGKNVDLSVNILSAAAWPTYPDIPVNVPQNVQKAIGDFELHYKSTHSGRKLDWKHALAHCQMRATFPKGNKELVVSSFQAIVLLLFNGLSDTDRLSYEHIRSETGLPEAEVKRTLQSLACAKLQPLRKHPRGRDINDDDTFSINANFEHPRQRVKINQVQLKETKQENRETHERVQEDRNFETQAAIVRILKSRKTIGHSELISEVIKATLSRGRLEVADIKKNIDRLIEKDYMEREDGNMYSYVA